MSRPQQQRNSSSNIRSKSQLSSTQYPPNTDSSSTSSDDDNVVYDDYGVDLAIPIRPTYSDYDDDDEEEEDEQERLLSLRHGEASESHNKSNGKETDQDIANQLAKAAKNNNGSNTSSARKSRPVLTPDHLLHSSKGLMKIRHSFGRKSCLRYHEAPNADLQCEIKAAAHYSNQLLSCYASFTHDLFPSMAHQDVLTKIESLGSKKQVRDFLQQMREDVCRDYVIQKFGREKGNALLYELECGLKRQKESSLDDEGVATGRDNMASAMENDTERDENEWTEPPTQSVLSAVRNPYKTTTSSKSSAAATRDTSLLEEEEEATFEDATLPLFTSSKHGVDKVKEKENSTPEKNVTPLDTKKKNSALDSKVDWETQNSASLLDTSETTIYDASFLAVSSNDKGYSDDDGETEAFFHDVVGVDRSRTVNNDDDITKNSKLNEMGTSLVAADDDVTDNATDKKESIISTPPSDAIDKYRKDNKRERTSVNPEGTDRCRVFDEHHPSVVVNDSAMDIYCSNFENECSETLINDSSAVDMQYSIIDESQGHSQDRCTTEDNDTMTPPPVTKLRKNNLYCTEKQHGTDPSLEYSENTTCKVSPSGHAD